MREERGDLWSYIGKAQIICITTNGEVNWLGRAVMGRGVALQAKRQFKSIDEILGRRLREEGNNVHMLCGVKAHAGIVDDLSSDSLIFSFPVKRHWRDDADPALIVRSAQQLAAIVDLYKRTPNLRRKIECVALPRPGCGAGRLSWEQVAPLIRPILDDRFVVVHDGRES